MGLDVYVGPLTRYYAGEWETVVQALGREQGIPVQTIRTQPEPDDAIKDPAEIGRLTNRWREGLAMSLRKAGMLDGDLSWAEGVDVDYVTDKPGWDCFGALVLLAAYEEEPKPLFGSRWPKKLDENWGSDERLRKRIAGAEPRYSHLYGCELWLPVELKAPFKGPRPTGQQTKIGSCLALASQLEELNSRTYAGSPADLEQWARDMPDGTDRRFEPNAKTGLAIMLHLTREAASRRLPMLLDY